MKAKDNLGLKALISCTISIFLPGSLIFGFPGLMNPVWKEMLAIESGALSYIMFFLLASLGIFMFFVGKWTAILGVRKLIIIGTAITSLATVLVALAPSIVSIYIWAFSVGAASCFVYSPGINCVQRWFPTRRGLVSGIVNLTFGISAAVMVPIYRLVLEGLGYRELCLGVAALAIVLGVIGSRHANLPSSQSSSNVSLDDSLEPAQAVKTANFWIIWAVWALMGGAGISMVTLSVSYGLHLGYSMAAAVGILTAFNLTNGLSRILSGALSDLIGRKITLAGTFFIAGVAYFMLPSVGSIWGAMVLAALIGYGYGTLFSVSAPIISDCFGLKHFGVILGLVFTAYGFIASIIGPALSGYMLNSTGGNYKMIFYYLAILSIVSGVLILGVNSNRNKGGSNAN